MAINKRLIKSNDEGGGVAASFNTVTYTGDGNDNRQITGVGFEPDFIWMKNRTVAWGYTLVDRVRGLNAASVYGALASDQAAAEDTTNTFGAIKTLDLDGFTIKDGTDINGYYAVNRLNNNYVAWCWKAGGAAVSNTNGSITSQVSANQDAGFSIVKYTGNLTASTVGTGLSSAAELIIVKRTDSGANWFVYSQPTGNTKYLYLDGANAAATFNLWNNTSPTSSVFSLAGQGDVNASGGSYIAYCFHSVDGYSKIGSYVGTGTTLQTIVTGFRPAFMLFRAVDITFPWELVDNKRPEGELNANNSDAERIENTPDFLENGFRLTTERYNNAGQKFIYLAIA